MVRHLLAVAAAVALLSTGALAQDFDAGSKTVIHKSTADGMDSKKVIIKRHSDGFGASKKVVIKRNNDGFGASKKVVIKRHDDRYGALVTKKKIIRGDHMAGSSMGGTTVVKKRTFGY